MTSIARVMMAADFTMDNATTSLTAGNMTNTTAEDEAALNSTRDQVTSLTYAIKQGLPLKVHVHSIDDAVSNRLLFSNQNADLP